MATLDVHDYGAQGVGGDDSAAIQACLDAARPGDEVVFRAGVYGETMGPAGERPPGWRSALRCRGKVGLTVRGQGPRTVIKSLAEDWDQSRSDRHTWVWDRCADFRIRDLDFDMSRGEVITHKDQSHALELIACKGFRVVNVGGLNVRADLVRMQGWRDEGCIDWVLQGLRCYNSGRSALGFHGGVHKGRVHRLDAEECTDQFIDFEPRGKRGAPSSITFDRLNLRGRPGQVVFSLAGISEADPLLDVVVMNSTITGTLNPRNFKRLTLEGCVVDAGPDAPALLWNGWGAGLALIGSVFRGKHAVRAAPQGASSRPRDLRLEACDVETTGPALLLDQVQQFRVSDTAFRGPGSGAAVKVKGRGLWSGYGELERCSFAGVEHAVEAEGAVTNIQINDSLLRDCLPFLAKGKARALKAAGNAKVAA